MVGVGPYVLWWFFLAPEDLCYLHGNPDNGLVPCSQADGNFGSPGFPYP